MTTSTRISRSRPVATALAAIVAASGISFTSTVTLAEEASDPASSAPTEAKDGAAGVESGVAASMYFTDEFGNRREPTAEELRQAAEAFQRDLARLAGQQRGKPNVRSRPDGTVSATVAVSKLAFLTVHENEDGELIYGHSSLDEEGNVTFASPNVLPEK